MCLEGVPFATLHTVDQEHGLEALRLIMNRHEPRTVQGRIPHLRQLIMVPQAKKVEETGTILQAWSAPSGRMKNWQESLWTGISWLSP